MVILKIIDVILVVVAMKEKEEQSICLYGGSNKGILITIIYFKKTNFIVKRDGIGKQNSGSGGGRKVEGNFKIDGDGGNSDTILTIIPLLKKKQIS